MKWLKRRLRTWLEVDHLLDYVVATRAEIGLPEDIAAIYDDDGTVYPLSSAKGREIEARLAEEFKASLESQHNLTLANDHLDQIKKGYERAD